jgi:drug/metabolite transporter superfamily protein YnfA
LATRGVLRAAQKARLSMSSTAQVAVMVVAALLEVMGDAIIRKGVRGAGIGLVALGFIVLGSYGVVVNRIAVDFSKLLGAYVGVFAIVSVLFGRIVFQETIPRSTWLGLVVVLVGSSIIQFGGGGAGP